MSDLPENLQIKREPSPPSTPEDKSPNNIKAKLNLHVKRRLQDYNQTTEDNPNNSSQHSPHHQQQKSQQPLEIKQEPSTQKPAEVVRQKRPYNKRTDKQKNANQQQEATNLATSSSATAGTTPQRKYKHKIKQIVGNVDATEALNTSNLSEETLTSSHNVNITAGAISAGDEDEVTHDNELKAGREKEKCPDVLAMVLSMKKRALMQDPEVQNFLKEVMEVIKS